MGSDGCQTALQRLELWETQNTECGLVKFARVAGHCTGWAKGRPACFSHFVYVVDKNFYGSTMQKVQDAIYTSMAARKLGFAESPSVLRLHGFSIRQTSLRSLLYITWMTACGPSHTAGTLKIARGEVAFLVLFRSKGKTKADKKVITAKQIKIRYGFCCR